MLHTDTQCSHNIFILKNYQSVDQVDITYFKNKVKTCKTEFVSLKSIFVLFQVFSFLPPVLAILLTTGPVTSVFERSGNLTLNSRPLSWKKNSCSTPTSQNRNDGNWQEILTWQKGKSKYGKLFFWKVIKKTLSTSSIILPSNPIRATIY